MQVWPEDGTRGWHHLQLFLSLYENRSSQSKDIFLFFTSLHFFLFLHYLRSHSLSFVARPCFFASQGVGFFHTICCHHLSSSVPNITQSIQSLAKVSQKILPILPPGPIWQCTAPLSEGGETPSFPHPLILPVLPAIVLWGRVQERRSCYQRGNV